MIGPSRGETSMAPMTTAGEFCSIPSVAMLADSVPALIAYFDHKKAYRYINRGYQEWFGLDPQRPDRALRAVQGVGRHVGRASVGGRAVPRGVGDVRAHVNGENADAARRSGLLG